MVTARAYREKILCFAPLSVPKRAAYKGLICTLKVKAHRVGAPRLAPPLVQPWCLHVTSVLSFENLIFVIFFTDLANASL